MKKIIISAAILGCTFGYAQKTKDIQEVNLQGLNKEKKQVKEIHESVNPVTIISGKEIESRTSNLNEILARQAGIQIRQTGGVGSESRVSVRGLEGKRVQIFVDNKPLYAPDGSLSINDIPVQLIERIEIYKGTVPVYLGGDSLGSAVNIIIKHRENSYVDANASVQSFGAYSAGLLAKKAFEKPGIEIGGGIIRTEAKNNYKMDSPYQPGLVITRDHDRYENTMAGLSFKFHKWYFDEIELEGVIIQNKKQIQGVHTNIQEAKTSGKTAFMSLNIQKNNFAFDHLRLDYSLSADRAITSLDDQSPYSYAWDGTKTASYLGLGEIGIGPNLSHNTQSDISQRVNLYYKISPVFSVNFNNVYRYAHFNPKDDLGNEYAKKNIYNYPGSLETAVSGLNLEANVNKKLLLSATLKNFYADNSGYNTNIYLSSAPDRVNLVTKKWGYNAGARYKINDDLLLKASYERGLRLPNASELFGDGFLISPNITLKPEESRSLSGGVVLNKNFDDGRKLQVESNGFYMNVENMIQLAGNGLSMGYGNYAKVKTRGWDLDLKYDFTPTIYASYNFTYQKITDNNEFIPGTDRVENPTFGLSIPNIPKLFMNWTLEYHKDDLIGKNSRTRIIYDGSFVRKYNYGFNISAYDTYFIPSYNVHSMTVEQSFQNGRYTVAGEVNNFTNSPVLNSYNQPLPGINFRLKFRYLFLSKKH